MCLFDIEKFVFCCCCFFRFDFNQKHSGFYFCKLSAIVICFLLLIIAHSDSAMPQSPSANSLHAQDSGALVSNGSSSTDLQHKVVIINHWIIVYLFLIKLYLILFHHCYSWIKHSCERFQVEVRQTTFWLVRSTLSNTQSPPLFALKMPVIWEIWQKCQYQPVSCLYFLDLTGKILNFNKFALLNFCLFAFCVDNLQQHSWTVSWGRPCYGHVDVWRSISRCCV